MTFVSFLRILPAAALAVLITACGGAVRPPTVVPEDARLVHRAINVKPGSLLPRRDPWMLPDSKSRDLLYVTSLTGTYVYSYPDGRLEGILTEGDGADCVDAKGNIWVPDASRSVIFKYAHGGTNPIATLRDSFTPFGCSVDPATGNLAIANEYNLAIFARAKGTATIYHDPNLEYNEFAGYDPKGNLFISGIRTDGFSELAELPRGSDKFTDFSLYVGAALGVQWDGKYITFGDDVHNTIWQVKITPRGPKFEGQTGLFGAGNPAYQYTYSNFRMTDGQAARVVAMDIPYSVGVWNYPAGGTPRRIYTGSYYALGVAISPASK